MGESMKIGLRSQGRQQGTAKPVCRAKGGATRESRFTQLSCSVWHTPSVATGDRTRNGLCECEMGGGTASVNIANIRC